MTRLSESAQKLLAIVSDAAARGVLCPTNLELAERFGKQSMSACVPWFRELEEAGLIRVDRFHRSRVVTIVATGAATQAPRHAKKHWRDRTEEERAADRQEKAQRVARCAGAKAPVGLAGGRVPVMRLPFAPFTDEEAAAFDDALADGVDIEMAAIRAGRSRLCGYRQFHRICDELGEEPR